MYPNNHRFIFYERHFNNKTIVKVLCITLNNEGRELIHPAFGEHILCQQFVFVVSKLKKMSANALNFELWVLYLN